MRTPASIKGHPLHVMLVPLPIGLWIFALVADILTASGGSPEWRTVAFYCLGGGVIGALLAALPGLVDLLSLEPGPHKRLGVWHMAINLASVAVFAANFVLRWNAVDHSGPLLLTLIGVISIGVSGWMGGEMVYVHRVGVEAADGSSRRSS